MRRSLTAVAVVGVCLAVFAWQEWAARQPRIAPRGQPALVDVRQSGVEELRRQFNAAERETRVVALLSPT